MELINSFKKYLVAIVPELVYKSVTQAEANETSSSRLNGDLYIEAKLKTGSFDSIPEGKISRYVLNQVGIYDSSMISSINSDKYLIPKELREKVLNLHREYIINNYEEQNPYYRMLCGLPNSEEDNIYLSPEELASFGYTNDKLEDYENDNFDKLTPLHKLPENVLILMESTGYLDEVYNDYSAIQDYDARYIKHLGVKKIDPIISRLASQYEIIYFPVVDDATRFTRDFTNFYEEARRYFLNQIYNYHYNSEYEFYEGYMGFFILVMAIERTINSLFEVVVQRDFYDIETCRMFLEAYGVPFVQTFTFNQQIALVKNLNILLMEKCTTNVLFDLLDLLDYDRYSITKYLLVKQHKFKQSGEEQIPVFKYRTILADDGTPTYELAKSEMYDYYFISRDIRDSDTTLVEESDPDAYDYELITEDDAYWIEDSDLIEKLQNDEINFVETKYASVSITIRMYEVLFEQIYLQKMLCDKGSETSKIEVDIPLITNYPVTLLDMEVLLICLLCKYHNMSPDLLTSPSKELAVLGFNFDADLEKIKSEVLSNKNIYSEELVNFIKDKKFNTVADVNEMFYNVKSLNTLIVKGMENTKSPDVYFAYKKLYQALLITDVHNEVFVLPDGTIPETYMDWLKSYNYPLYTYIENIDKTEIIDKINYITTKMISWFTNAKHLEYLNPMDDVVINGIIKILRWFKSYTIDIKDLDIIYLFDSKYHNIMKFLDKIWIHVKSTIREVGLKYNDFINSISADTFMKLYSTYYDAIKMYNRNTYKDYDLFLKDKITGIKKSLIVQDKINGNYLDYLVKSVCECMIKKDRLMFRDSIRIIDPDDINNSKLVHRSEYISDQELMILHDSPLSSKGGTDSLNYKVKPIVEDETLKFS